MYNPCMELVEKEYVGPGAARTCMELVEKYYKN